MPPKKAKRANTKREHRHEHAVIKKTGVDIGFLAVVILLTVLGLIMVFSASYPSANYKYDDGLYFIRKQALWAIIGVGAMIATMKIDYRIYKKNALWILVATVVLLVLVLASTPIKGSRRWLGFGAVSFQPSELAKIAMIIYLAAVLSTAKERIREFMVLFKHGVVLVVVLVLLYVEPHFSVCLIIGAVAFIMFMVAGAQWKHFAAIALVVVPIVVIAATKAGYRVDRLAMYFDPFKDPRGAGWQIIQSLYAIGSGGLFGLGFGNSRQKYMYVSEPQNDFIFSIVCEELGMIGAFVIIILFGVLIWRGIKIAINAPDTFAGLLVTGIVSLVGVQTFLNIAVVTKLIPTTGISLPFFSAGGSSLVFLMAAMGMVLNVSKYQKQVVDLR